MISTNKIDKLVKKSEDINEESQLSSRENQENLSHVDRVLQSLDEKVKHHCTSEAPTETVADKTEVREPCVQSKKETNSMINDIEIRPNSIDFETNKWKTICYTQTKKVQTENCREMNKCRLKNLKRNCTNFTSNLQPEKYQSGEQYAYQNKFQQNDFDNATNEGVDFAVSSKKNFPNKTNLDFGDYLFNRRVKGKNFNQERIKNLTNMYDKLNIHDVKINSMECKEVAKERNQYQEFLLNNEKSINPLYARNSISDINSSKCRLKNNSYSKDAQNQTCQQIGDEKFNSITQDQKGLNYFNRTKKCKPKFKKNTNEKLLPNQHYIKKQLVSNSLERDTINQNQLNEYLKKSVSKYPNHCNTEKYTTNLNNHSNVSINASSTNLTNLTDYMHKYQNKTNYLQSNDISRETNLESVWSNESDINTEAGRIAYEQSNNQILYENAYSLPEQPVSIIPLQPYIDVSTFGSYPNGTLISAPTAHCFDTGMLYNYEYPSEFQNAVSLDHGPNYYESINIEQCSNQNFRVQDADLIDLQKRPFALSWVDKGETYFQYYYDFAPVAYPCLVFSADQRPFY